MKITTCTLCPCESDFCLMHGASDGRPYCACCYERIQTVGIKDKVPPVEDENDER